jgi:tetratricopeptide (TPR) repeat protein
MMIGWWVVILACPDKLVAQKADELETDLKNAGGFQRLEILHALTDEYIRTKDRKSLKYGREGLKLADNLLGENVKDRLWVKSQYLLAKAYYSQEKYFTAKEYFTTVKLIANRNIDPEIVSSASEFLSKIDSIAKTEEGLNQGFLSRTLTDINLGGSFSDLKSSVETNYLMSQADKAVEKGEYSKAIESYNKAAAEFNQNGELEALSDVYRKVGSVFKLMEEEEKSREYFEKASSVDAINSKKFVAPDPSKLLFTEAPTIRSSDSMLQALEKKGYSVNSTKKQKKHKTDTKNGDNLSTAKDQLEEQ